MKAGRSHLAGLIAAAALLAAVPAAASTSTASAEVRVQATNPAGDVELARRDCAFVQGALVVAFHRAVDVECATAAMPGPAQSRVPYVVHYEHRADRSLRVAVDNLAPVDETDTAGVSWTVEPGDEPAQKISSQRLIANYFTDRGRNRLNREFILLGGVPSSTRLTVTPEGDYFDRKLGRVVGFEEAWKTFRDESPKQKHFLLAATEIVSVLGAGFIAYYTMFNAANSPEWLYDFDWKGFRAKTSWGPNSGVRFDNNAYGWNMVGHPIGGALDYLFARTNGFSRPESFLFALGAFALWDYLVQFHSTVSINDLFFTPIAGVAVGEAMFQMSEFFARGEDNLVNRVLSGIFGGPAAFNRWVDKNHPKRSENLDRNGFDASLFHQFQLFAGAGGSVTTGGAVNGGVANGGAAVPVATAGFDTELINIEEYGKPGVVNRVLTDATFTRMVLQATFGAQGVVDWTWFVKTSLAGYYKQSIEKGVGGELKGYSFYIGTATAYNLSKGPTGVVNVIGPSLDLTWYYKGFRIRCSLDVYGDFAAVSSYAVDRYAAQGGDLADTKSVLRNQKYYYAFGVTVTPRVVMNYGPFEAGAELTYDWFSSIEGHDQTQPQITNDFHLSDERLRWQAWIGYRLPGDRIKLQLAIQQRWGAGRIGALTVEQLETSVLGELVFLF